MSISKLFENKGKDLMEEINKDKKKGRYALTGKSAWLGYLQINRNFTSKEEGGGGHVTASGYFSILAPRTR